MFIIVRGPVQKSAGSSSNGNGGGSAEKNADGSTTYQDPLDVYCDDNPETDECRYEPKSTLQAPYVYPMWLFVCVEVCVRRVRRGGTVVHAPATDICTLVCKQATQARRVHMCSKMLYGCPAC